MGEFDDISKASVDAEVRERDAHRAEWDRRGRAAWERMQQLGRDAASVLRREGVAPTNFAATPPPAGGEARAWSGWRFRDISIADDGTLVDGKTFEALSYTDKNDLYHLPGGFRAGHPADEPEMHEYDEEDRPLKKTFASGIKQFLAAT